MNIWDISRTLSNDLAPWPGDTPFRFELTARMAEGAVVNIGAINTSVHNGSHADAPFHFDANGSTIDQAELKTYFGRAVVADLTKYFAGGDHELIEVKHLEPHAADIADATRLLLKTGVWRDSATFPTRIPVIAPDVADWLRAREVKLLGLDLPSVDHLDAKVLQNHHALAGAGIVIVESLELNEIEGGVYNFVAFPLKIAGGDGSPVRAILWRE
jgi:arylformamidase